MSAHPAIYIVDDNADVRDALRMLTCCLIYECYRAPGRLTEVLTFEPEGFQPRLFRKGQVVWVTFRSPFSILEHLFTIASDPTEDPKINFILRERGDWTKHIGELPPGSRAYLNGPYG